MAAEAKVAAEAKEAAKVPVRPPAPVEEPQPQVPPVFTLLLQDKVQGDQCTLLYTCTLDKSLSKVPEKNMAMFY